MADKNREIAMNVLEAVGGAANVSSVAHCMTRLRFVLKDQSIPKSKEIEKISGVVGTNVAGGQYQVIIGNNVGNVYKQLMTLEGISDLDTSNQEVTKKEKQNPVSIALDFISGCMSPLFPALVAGGLLKVLAVILGPTLTGVLATTSDTYVLMSALADVPFYFLPILVAFNASKKLNCNTSLAVMVASVLIYPDVISLLGTDKATHLFGVIPVIHGNYVSSIIPAMLAVILFKYVEIGIDKFTPEWSKKYLKSIFKCCDQCTNYFMCISTTWRTDWKWTSVCDQYCLWIRTMACNGSFCRVYAIYRYDRDALGVPSYSTDGISKCRI